VSTTQALTLILLIAIVLLGGALYALYRVRSRILRVVLSIVSGCLTFYTVALALSLNPAMSSVLEAYLSVFTIRDRVAHCCGLEPWSDNDEFYGPGGRIIATVVMIGFWTIFFGSVYFRFVVRKAKETPS
jgi:hypothetical protein